MNKIKAPVLLAFFLTLHACDSDQGKSLLLSFEAYQTAVKSGLEDKWHYTTDTVKLWFDDKNGTPILQVKGKKSSGKWKAWDKAMHATSRYDSLWYDRDDHCIKAYFYENNDFYDLIGKSPTKTLRSFWLNNDNKIHEILIYWIPEENTTTAEHLAPIVEWALKNDSLEIRQIYPNNAIVPSEENARRWKKLLERYNREKG